MEEKTFLNGMALICKTFSVNPDRPTLEVWKMLLQDLDDADFIPAVIHLCRTKEKAPPNLVAAIRNEIGANELTCEEAWQQVAEAIRRVGSWGTPQFKDEAITKAVEALGWKYICQTENNNMGTLRAHFYRTYDACRNRVSIQETFKMIEENTEIKRLVDGVSKALSSPQQNEDPNRDKNHRP